MDLVQRATELRREASARRRSLAVVFLVALLCGSMVLLRPGLPPEPRQHEVWLAEGQLLVDTSDSQVVDARAIGIETLAVRAILLGNLIGTSPLRDGIARRVGLDPDKLAVTPPASTAADAPPAPAAVPIDVPDAEATRLTVSTDPSLPIVRVLAQAPGGELAEGLVDAALEEVRAYVDSARADQAVPDARQLVVSALGPASAHPETRGPGIGAAALVALLAALAGCAAVLAFPLLGARAKPDDEATVAATNGHSRTGARRVKRASTAKSAAAKRRAKQKTRSGQSRSA